MGDLMNLSVNGFVEVLASGTPAPGGGSAAALSGALGCALGAMVCELSIGRKKFLDREAQLTEARDALNALRRELQAAVDSDARAYDAVALAMKLPKDNEERKAQRQGEIQAALEQAAQSPLSVLRKATEALGWVERLTGQSNANAASDLGTAVALLRAAAEGAWLNVLINLDSMTDAARAERLHTEAQALHERATRS